MASNVLFTLGALIGLGALSAVKRPGGVGPSTTVETFEEAEESDTQEEDRLLRLAHSYMEFPEGVLPDEVEACAKSLERIGFAEMSLALRSLLDGDFGRLQLQSMALNPELFADEEKQSLVRQYWHTLGESGQRFVVEMPSKTQLHRGWKR